MRVCLNNGIVGGYDSGTMTRLIGWCRVFKIDFLTHLKSGRNNMMKMRDINLERQRYDVSYQYE